MRRNSAKGEAMARLIITLHGHLIVGGGEYSAGVDAATIRRFEGGHGVPYIPATAIRGAIRIQLESLLTGLKGSAVGPYPLEGQQEDKPKPKDDPVSLLFGYSGRAGERSNSKHGHLRFSDALPIDPAAARGALAIRAGVQIDDDTGAAEDKKLFFREVVELSPNPLKFECRLDTGNATADDLQRLREAVATTFSLGGNQSSGGGEIEIEWIDADPRQTTETVGEISTATRARLTMTLLEPAHFGDGGPIGNHHGTRSYIPGSTVRGAVAWALLRNKACKGDDPAFQSTFVGPTPVSFGDGLPVAAGNSEPSVRPATLRKPRVPSNSGIDVLKRELIRQRLNERLLERGLYLRTDWNNIRPDPEPARVTERVLRRTRTRVSIDRELGTAADGKLFSIEQIEPFQTPDPATGNMPRTTFVSRIENLSAEAAQLLAKLEGIPLLVGAGRNHGLGLVEAKLEFEPEPPLGAPVKRIEELGEAIDRELETLADQLGLDSADLVWSDEVPMVLMSASDFLPAADFEHPLAEFEAVCGKPFWKVLTSGAVGGYDQQAELEGARSPLKDLLASVGAGSLYAYRVARGSVEELLRKALPKLRRGMGRGVRNGCGRFVLYGEFSK